MGDLGALYQELSLRLARFKKTYSHEETLLSAQHDRQAELKRLYAGTIRKKEDTLRRVGLEIQRLKGEVHKQGRQGEHERQ